MLQNEVKPPAFRWFVWGVMALAFLVVYFHRVSTTVVMDRLMVDFQVQDATVLGSIAATYFYVYLVMQIPSGLLADFFGPRYTVTAGMLLAGAGSLVFGSAPTLLFLFLGRFMVGLGVSVVFISILKAQTNWFRPQEFSTLTGMTVLVGNLGAVIGTTPLAFAVNNYGWREAFFVVGVFSFLTALLCWLIVRDNPVKKIENPNKLAFKDLGVAIVAISKNFHTWPPFLLAFSIYGTLLAFSGAWGVPYLMQIYDLTRSQASNFMMVIAFGMMVGCPLIGFVSDKIKRRKEPFIFIVLLYVGAWLALTFINGGKPPIVYLYPIFFMMGIGGSCMVLAFTCTKEVNNPEFTGMATGIVNVGAFLGISILQPLMGYILDKNWQGTLIEGIKTYPQEAYLKTFLLCIGIVLLASGSVFLLKETKATNIYQQRIPKTKK